MAEKSKEDPSWLGGDERSWGKEKDAPEWLAAIGERAPRKLVKIKLTKMYVYQTLTTRNPKASKHQHSRGKKHNSVKLNTKWQGCEIF